MGQILARAWEILSRRVDNFLFGIALTIAGIGLITLYSATDQSYARLSSQAMSLPIHSTGWPMAAWMRSG